MLSELATPKLSERTHHMSTPPPGWGEEDTGDTSSHMGADTCEFGESGRLTSLC